MNGLPPVFGGGLQPGEAAGRLRSLLAGGPPLVVPGAADALTARLIEEAGFEACYATGAGVANLALGLADVGLLTMPEMADAVTRMCDAVRIPVIADADTGHGGPVAVARTVHSLERAGAAAVQLEDQAMPKRCGHFAGKRLVDVAEMVARIRAATTVRDTPLVVIARTDARAEEGFDAALERALRYAGAGADALFVEAPTSVEELAAIGERLRGLPLVVNMVPGGRTPLLDAEELGRLGFRIVLHANLALRIAVQAVQRALTELRRSGTSAAIDDLLLPWVERQRLVRLAELDALEAWLTDEGVRPP